VIGVGLAVKDTVRRAAASVLEHDLANMESDGDISLDGRRDLLAARLAESLERVGLLSLTGETAIALELVAAGWGPVGKDLAEASVHGVHLGGIMQSGEEDHVADYLRVMEAQHSRSAPQPLERYRALARRLRSAYRDATPDMPTPADAG